MVTQKKVNKMKIWRDHLRETDPVKYQEWWKRTKARRKERIKEKKVQKEGSSASR